MRFAGHLSNGASYQRSRVKSRALQIALFAMLLASAANAGAESAMISSRSGQGAASALLGFTIVIPVVLILDRRTGTFYTNDAKAIVSLGAIGQLRAAGGVDREGFEQAGRGPATAIGGGHAGRGHQARGPSGIAGSVRRFADGEVICIP